MPRVGDGGRMDEMARLTLALAERYEILRELGGGGMSRVFLAIEFPAPLQERRGRGATWRAWPRAARAC